MGLRWMDMRTTCLRRSQTPIHRNVLRLLNVHVRLYGTKPRLASLPPASRTVNDALQNDKASKKDIKARHWLRAILRECTYLPDPKARRYVSQYVISRFRTYGFKTWKNSKRPINGFGERLKAKEKEARLAVNLLKRANEGETKPLLKVLFMTYGRSGKRRHELMAPLLVKPAEDENGVAIDNSNDVLVYDKVEKDVPQDRSSDRAKFTSHETLPKLTPALYQLLESQRQAEPPSRTRPNPRRLKPDIPALNSKMRSMPASRVKNMTKKWYSDVLDRTLPPLPTDEWHQLCDLAHGRGLSRQPPRRKAPESIDFIAKRDASALEMVVTGGSHRVDKRVFGNPEAHTITPRYMQRLYAIVFRQCPLMEFDSEANKWTVTWGKYELYRKVNAPSNKHEEKAR